MPGTLYLIPNLLGIAAPDDVLPARTIKHAKRINHFIVETPKVARAFLKTLSHERTIADVHMYACADAGADSRAENTAIAQCLAWLKAGHDVGVLSDAGCPGMADPGAAFVAAAHQANIAVVPLVGPSSLLLGLMASGLNGQHITFHGYLPAKADARDATLKQLERAVKTSGATQAFIETPYRNAAIMEAIRKQIAGDVVLCVAQNLASEGERVVAKPVGAWNAKDVENVSGKAPALFLLGWFAVA
ncbi:MAG: SAM-dependent methyltransferase [Casimicrobium sp.]